MDTPTPRQQSSTPEGAQSAAARASEVQTVLGESGRRRRRRTRRHHSKARRIAKALGPILIVVGLCVLSMGVIKVVEVSVPTKAAFTDAQRAESERQQISSNVRELAETLEAGWAPSFQEGEDLFFVEDFADFEMGEDPFLGPGEARIADDAWVPADRPSSLVSGTTSPLAR